MGDNYGIKLCPTARQYATHLRIVVVKTEPEGEAIFPVGHVFLTPHAHPDTEKHYNGRVRIYCRTDWGGDITPRFSPCEVSARLTKALVFAHGPTDEYYDWVEKSDGSRELWRMYRPRQWKAPWEKDGGGV